MAQRKAQISREIAGLRFQAMAAEKRSEIIKEEIVHRSARHQGPACPAAAAAARTRAGRDRRPAGAGAGGDGAGRAGVGESEAQILQLQSDRDTEIAQSCCVTPRRKSSSSARTSRRPGTFWAAPWCARRRTARHRSPHPHARRRRGGRRAAAGFGAAPGPADRHARRSGPRTSTSFIPGIACAGPAACLQASPGAAGAGHADLCLGRPADRSEPRSTPSTRRGCASTRLAEIAARQSR